MLAPKLRFKEFNDEWNYKLFNETFEFIQNNSFSRDMLNYSENSKIYNIHYGDILTKYGEIIDFNIISNIVPKINDDISLSKFEDKSYLKNGDIIIADTAEDLTVGKSCEVVNLHCKALSGLHTIPCRPKFKFASQYLGEYINSTSYHSQLIPYITGIKVSSISKTSIIKTKIYFPTVKEQEKISKLFSLLNKKIELQQRKIEVLKMYKKGLSDNIYASLKEKIIELNNYAIVQGGFAFKSELFQKKGKPIVRISNIYNNLVDLNDLVYYDSALEIDKKFYVNDSDLLIAMSGATTGKYGIYHNTYPAYLNQRVGKIICKKDTILYYPYLYFLFGLTAYEKQLQSRLIAGAQPNISPADIESMKFKFPNINTQKKIADMIINITKKISIENKKLDNLNILKQSLLQQMFI